MWATLVAAGAAGLVSIPHCALMCGPLAASSCTSRQASLRYQAGRIAGYSLLGLAVGAGGSALAAWLKSSHVAVGAALGMAVALLLSARQLWQPAAAPGRRVRLKLVRERPMLLGSLTALLPCGALASAVILAASTASPPEAALVMATFAVATSLGTLAAPAILLRFGAMGASRRVVASILVLGATVLVLRAVNDLRGHACCDTRKQASSGGLPRAFRQYAGVVLGAEHLVEKAE